VKSHSIEHHILNIYILYIPKGLILKGPNPPPKFDLLKRERVRRETASSWIIQSTSSRRISIRSVSTPATSWISNIRVVPAALVPVEE